MANLFTDTQVALSTNTQTAGATTLYENMYLVVDTTDFTAGTLDIEVEWSHNNIDFYSFSTPDVFTQIVATGRTWLGPVPGRTSFFRLDYTVATGPFDFVVSVVAY